jgi:hypothetical protein
LKLEECLTFYTFKHKENGTTLSNDKIIPFPEISYYFGSGVSGNSLSGLPEEPGNELSGTKINPTQANHLTQYLLPGEGNELSTPG